MDLSDYTTSVNKRDSFSMTYGAEVILPLETNFPTLKTGTFTPSNNDKLLGRSLDLIEEKREKAMIQLAYY